MSVPNFSSLAGLEVAEKCLWGGVGGGLHSHYHVKPNRCVEVRVEVLTTSYLQNHTYEFCIFGFYWGFRNVCKRLESKRYVNNFTNPD